MQTVALTARGPRLLVGAVVVALGAGAGRRAGVDVIGYLVLAIPFTMAIRVGVLRRPVRRLWNRGMTAETGSRLRGAGIITALSLIIGLRALQSISHGTWIDDNWQVLVLAATTALARDPAPRAGRRGPGRDGGHRCGLGSHTSVDDATTDAGVVPVHSGLPGYEH
jgi:hypothetical protein